jgi:hypothetical protein
MGKKISKTKGLFHYQEDKFLIPGRFLVVENTTADDREVYNLLDYRTSRLDPNEIRSVIMRAKKDYGKAFEKLAAED